MVHLDQERHAMVPELAGPIAPRFDQFATVAFALATRTHAEGIQVKLRRFRFGGDTIIGITRLLSGRALERCIQLSGFGAVLEDSHPDQLPVFFHRQGILIADAVVLLSKKVA